MKAFFAYCAANAQERYFDDDSDDPTAANFEVKYNFKKKCVPKVMLYIAVCSKGISKPYIEPGICRSTNKFIRRKKY